MPHCPQHAELGKSAGRFKTSFRLTAAEQTKALIFSSRWVAATWHACTNVTSMASGLLFMASGLQNSLHWLLAGTVLGRNRTSQVGGRALLLGSNRTWLKLVAGTVLGRNRTSQVGGRALLLGSNRTWLKLVAGTVLGRNRTSQVGGRALLLGSNRTWLKLVAGTVLGRNMTWLMLVAGTILCW